MTAGDLHVVAYAKRHLGLTADRRRLRAESPDRTRTLTASNRIRRLAAHHLGPRHHGPDGVDALGGESIPTAVQFATAIVMISCAVVGLTYPSRLSTPRGWLSPASCAAGTPGLDPRVIDLAKS